jgi:membrane fusion protein (multidrug efflux system)
VTTTVSDPPHAAEAGAPAAAKPAKKASPASKMRKRIIIGAIATVVVCVGFGYWLYERQFEDTDDAQIDANISNISPRVTGTVTAVHVIENQPVAAGALLAELDPRDLQVAVDLAKAQVAQADAQLKVEDPTVAITEKSNQTTVATTGSDLASAAAGVDQARKTVDQLAAQLVQAQANDRNAQLDVQRAQALLKDGAIAQADFDQKSAAADASSANVEAIRQSLAAARASVAGKDAAFAATKSRLSEARTNAPMQLEERRASVIYRQASLDAAKAQLAQAELNLSYAQIRSPVDGIVGKKNVDVGDRVSPGQEIIAITQTQQVWVTANFRETQLRKLSPGQSATIHVDSLGTDLHGSVESIGGATGSRYSVLPPENATGNYVKVVQRIPVRIKLDPGQPGLDRLRPGMSVEPKVRVE